MANTYQAAGTHYDATIKDAAAKGDTIAKNLQTIIGNAQDKWKEAYTAGDQSGMDHWHDVAEAARAKYGYSGGADGTEFISSSSGEAPYDNSPGGSHSGGGASNSGVNSGTKVSNSAAASKESESVIPADPYKAYQYTPAVSAEDYIRKIYAAQQEENLSALKTAYEQNVLELDNTAGRLPQQYTAARNAASGASEVNRAAFNEYAAANGLSSGTGGQAQLSMSNALLGGLASISKSEADALSELELTRASMRASYNNSIRAAQAKGNYELAQALYAEMVRLDEANLRLASLQAGENYKEYMSTK